MATYVKTKAMNILDNLLCAKSIVSFMLTLAFCIMALRGDISNESFMQVFIMVISFHFGTHLTDKYISNEEKKNKKSTMLKEVEK